MALASAVVLGLMNNANHRRAPNCRRVACRMTESDPASSRLLANDIQRLAVEYRDWRLAKQQVQMKFGLKPRFYTKHNPRQGFTPEFSSWI